MNTPHHCAQTTVQLEKLHAIGYKPVLLLGKETKKRESKCEILILRCTLSSYAKEYLQKIGSFYEYLCEGWNQNSCGNDEITLNLTPCDPMEISATVEQMSPVVELISPVVEQMSPVVEQVNPVVEQMSPVVEQVEQMSPVVEQVSPVVEQMSPVVEQMNPVVEQMSTKEGQGQFYHGLQFEVSEPFPGKDPNKPDALMFVKGKELVVTRGWQRDFRQDVKNGENVPCWFIHNNGTGLLDGVYKDYIVSGLFKTI
ncbi:inter-alpha-trypsin inhibitor heavy chain H3-like protein [Labeo rohita]|uniref:Inter-alpha-trypsin inhibitor heavy chain H3-like protein n=1 Tax=Labeo rohita TaxID=84645 RepID=A0A498L757_LABRO|nr:inter-alpha-trypsin inhibitor heavy chain H3-like protein [Labeo rohita]